MGWRDIMWPKTMLGIMRPFTFFLIYVTVVAALVYRDASKRGMDPWLWAAVAAFVPFLIGVVIYLVVRSNGQVECGNCGKTIRAEYKVCPYCGKSRELLCAGCRRPVSPEWKVCPYCEASLATGPDPKPARA
jgi:RNA polymerase subunit RPABC4/transcription elongation factor Spt4